MKILITFLSLAFFSSDYVCKKDAGKNLDPWYGIELMAMESPDIYEYLEETKESLEMSVEDLSEEQMQFKPDDDSWSIAEIVEHIVIVEGALEGMLKGKIESGETPDQKAEVKMTDDQVLGLITDRSSKIQTQDQFVPSGKFMSADEALSEFNDHRKEMTNWLKSTDVDMRNYVNEFPFGKIDAYQTLLFMVGHTERHTAQIEEVKSNPDFPEE
ncbi:hypothetical protein GCM10023115_51950 [Pontixanthobacter gangjinensis]|uniref:DinB family protein n=1 Tax=Christiangramia aestuarii TaxID=1028746 RepID=A0A7K1LPP9_9FLAO|nr:DinB family protein [Christiangramia aestuarii]MUP42775.1 DinB family protein [Christiangramia aestuarii]